MTLRTLQEAHTCMFCTVRKIGLVLRFGEHIPKIQFSMAPKFMLQPFCRYNVKHTEKTAHNNITFDAPCMEKTKEHSNLWIPGLVLYQCATLTLVNEAKLHVDINTFSKFHQ